MNNGVIVNVKSHYSIVLSNGDFIRVVNKGDMVMGTPILFTEEDIYNNANNISVLKNSKIKINYRMLLATAVAFIFVFIGIQFSQPVPSLQTYALITAQINPTVQFALGRDGEVIDLIALNEDGKAVLDFDYQDKAFDDALMLYIDEVYKKGFIKQGATPKIKLLYSEKIPLKSPIDFGRVIASLKNRGFSVELIREDKEKNKAEISTAIATTGSLIESMTEMTATDFETKQTGTIRPLIKKRQKNQSTVRPKRSVAEITTDTRPKVSMTSSSEMLMTSTIQSIVVKVAQSSLTETINTSVEVDLTGQAKQLRTVSGRRSKRKKDYTRGVVIPVYTNHTEITTKIRTEGTTSGAIVTETIIEPTAEEEIETSTEIETEVITEPIGETFPETTTQVETKPQEGTEQPTTNTAPTIFNPTFIIPDETVIETISESDSFIWEPTYISTTPETISSSLDSKEIRSLDSVDVYNHINYYK